MVSCMPSVMAMEATPSAATKPVGATPKTGWSTESSARNQMRPRAMLMKIEPLGTLPLSKMRLMVLVAMVCRMTAMTIAVTRIIAFLKMSFSRMGI